MSDTKIEIKEIKEKIVEDKNNEKWKMTVEKQEANFGEKPKQGETNSTNKIKVKFEENKEGGQKVEEEINVKYDSGWFFKNVKLPKVINSSTLELKEEKSLDVKGFQPGFWIGGGVFVVVIGGLLWWWFSSSRKEDKEEESL